MKKLISVLLVLTLMLTALVGCGSKTEETQPATTVPVTEMTEATEAVPETTAPAVVETVAPPSSRGEEEAEEDSMKSLISAIYSNHAPMELMLDTLPNEYMPLETVMESFSYYTGLEDASRISDIAISEPMMGQAYSLVVVRVTDPEDAAAVAQEMYGNIDQRKWICVEADTKVAAYWEDVVLFFMVNSDFADQVTTKSIVTAFQNTVPSEVTIVAK